MNVLVLTDGMDKTTTIRILNQLAELEQESSRSPQRTVQLQKGELVMNGLAIEKQKLLTEWLGDCYHEIHHNGSMCDLCLNGHPVHLDFSDWRVIGRLVEKINSTGRAVIISPLSASVYGNVPEVASTPQLAICLAICAYLEGEK